MSRPYKITSGRWQARYYVTEGGKRRMRSAGTFATKIDAQDAIDHEKAKLRRGEWIDPDLRKTTVGDWCETWYGLRRAPSRKVRSALDARILPDWKDWRLGDVQPLNVQTWVNEMTRDGLAPVTVHNYYGALKRIFDKAVEHGLINRNPCSLRRGDLPKQVRTECVFLTVEQTRVLVALAPARHAAMIHTAIWSGLRIGELLALRWVDVDLEAGLITVNQAVKTDGGIGLPKNDTPRRVAIDTATIERLRAHRRDFGSATFVFVGERGARVEYANFRTRVWQPLVAQAFPSGPRPTFHDLRHTHCSLMIAQGMDWLVLADRMGHHAPSFTMDKYGHLRHRHDEYTRELLEAAVRLG
jgi:integrase